MDNDLEDVFEEDLCTDLDQQVILDSFESAEETLDRNTREALELLQKLY